MVVAYSLTRSLLLVWLLCFGSAPRVILNFCRVKDMCEGGGLGGERNRSFFVRNKRAD